MRNVALLKDETARAVDSYTVYGGGRGGRLGVEECWWWSCLVLVFEVVNEV